MEKLTHILAAIDLSPYSLNALDRGFQLAGQAGARYTVMHALGLDALGSLREVLGADAEDVARRAAENQRAALEALLADPARNRGRRAEASVQPGLATTVVPEFAAAAGADLTVLGARGERRLRRLLLGSTASHLLRKSRSPVLIVKRPCEGPYRRVLLPADFSPASALAISFARRLAPDAEFVLVNVVDLPFEGMLQRAGVSPSALTHYRDEARASALARLQALVAASGLDPNRVSVHVVRGDATQRILAHSNQGCDLIVMGKHGTHVTEDLLLGSVTKHVVEESDADVLVIVDGRAPESP